MYVTFDLAEIKMMPVNRLENNLRQSWRQAVVALVAFAVCIQSSPKFTETHWVELHVY